MYERLSRQARQALWIFEETYRRAGNKTSLLILLDELLRSPEHAASMIAQRIPSCTAHLSDYAGACSGRKAKKVLRQCVEEAIGLVRRGSHPNVNTGHLYVALCKSCEKLQSSDEGAVAVEAAQGMLAELSMIEMHAVSPGEISSRRSCSPAGKA